MKKKHHIFVHGVIPAHYVEFLSVMELYIILVKMLPVKNAKKQKALGNEGFLLFYDAACSSITSRLILVLLTLI